LRCAAGFSILKTFSERKNSRHLKMTRQSTNKPDDKHDREAARLYKLAADQGNADAQFNLGLFYEHGRGGLPKDDREAARLFKLAADQGYAVAQSSRRVVAWKTLVNLTRRGWPRQHEKLERQKEAAARERRRRQQEEQEPRRDAASGKMSTAQALEILGIKAGATEQEIRASYNRLMKRLHPDVGGSEYFTKQLNEARDVLLG